MKIGDKVRVNGGFYAYSQEGKIVDIFQGGASVEFYKLTGLPHEVPVCLFINLRHLEPVKGDEVIYE